MVEITALNLEDLLFKDHEKLVKISGGSMGTSLLLGRILIEISVIIRLEFFRVLFCLAVILFGPLLGNFLRTPPIQHICMTANKRIFKTI